MGLFYFDIIHAGNLIRDNEGSRLPDMGAIYREAEASIRELRTYFILKGEKIDNDEMLIRDADGAIVQRLKLQDIVI